MAVNTTAAELDRQKLFNAAIKRISKVWPEYSDFRPTEAQNATDRRAMERLQTTAGDLDAFLIAAMESDAPQGTQGAFLAVLAAWELERLHAAIIFCVDCCKNKR